MYKETTTGLNHPDCVLQQVQIQADLYETLAMVAATHHYINNGSANIEAVYTFPLPSDAVLLDMRLVVGDRNLIGQIIPKQQAEDRYEDAVAEGDLPAMLQNPSPGIYTLNIANIQPGERIMISFTYGLFLMSQGHDLRFTLPTTIAPRYGDPGKAGLVEHQVPETNFLAENRYSLTFVVHGQMASAAITSPSHDVRLEQMDNTVRMLFTQSSAMMDRDFVLTIAAPDMNHSTLMWDRDGDSHLLWASFHPHLDMKCDAEARALVMVVDCSGSMAGDSIDQAKNAAKNILKSLQPQDYFNIVAFGSNHKSSFRRMKKVDRVNLVDAMDFIGNLQADMGGTELEKALKWALGHTCKNVSTQDILLITDGEVWNIDDVSNLATKGRRRIFSIGVGSSPAESLLKNLSARTGGACEFVFPGESMTEKILRHVSRIYSPRIKTVDIRWPSRSEKTFPETLQAVFDGDTVHVFGWFAGRLESGVVGLSLNLSEGQAMQISAGDIEISQNCKTPGLIARMAAARQLAEMIDTEAATELAVKHQLLSRYTHCLAIAVQAEGEKAQTLPELQRVTQMMAAGWGGCGRIETDLLSQRVDFSFVRDKKKPMGLRGRLRDLTPTSAPLDMAVPMASMVFQREDFSPPATLEDSDQVLHIFYGNPYSEKRGLKNNCILLLLVEYLNRYDTNKDPELKLLRDHLPPAAVRAFIDAMCIELSDANCSGDDILIVFLHLFLKSDYGNNLNRNMSRIIIKRFQQANISEEIVKQISGKIEPIFCQNSLIDCDNEKLTTPSFLRRLLIGVRK
jgi:Ca-activated chloride channel homolog